MENESGQIFVLTVPEGQILVDPHKTGGTTQVNLQDASLSSVCRTCAAVTEYVIPIFSGEGLQNNLAEKIHKHLPIQVSQTDSLPQSVCFQCASTLLAWHELVACCVQADAALRTRAELDAAAERQAHAQKLQPPSIDVTETAATTSQEQTLEQQNKSAASPPPPPCRYCGVAVRTGAAARAHLVEAHAASLFECEECGDLADIGDLIAHMSHHAAAAAAAAAAPGGEAVPVAASPIVGESSEPSTPPSAGSPPRASSPDTSPSIIETPKKKKQKDDKPKLIEMDSPAPAEAVNYRATELKERDVSSLRDDNEFSDRSDSEDWFGPLPDSVFEAIEDSQDGEPDDPRTVAPKKPERKKPRDKQSRSCPICFKEYTVSSSYFYHMKYSHGGGGGKEHACSVCGRRLATRAGLAQHLLTHSDQLAYECKQCGKKFRTKASLYVHTQGHKGDKNWSCDQCGRRFVWRQLLLRHMKRHLVEKSHVCAVCGRGFSVRYDLLRHARTHTAGCHTCDKCGAEFAQVRYLKVHMHKKHKPASPGNSGAKQT